MKVFPSNSQLTTHPFSFWRLRLWGLELRRLGLWTLGLELRRLGLWTLRLELRRFGLWMLGLGLWKFSFWRLGLGLLLSLSLPTWNARAQSLHREYMALSAESVDQELKNLKDHQILFVPGLFSGFVDLYSCYYCEYYTALESMGFKKGLDFKKIRTHTESSIGLNIPLIHNAIVEADKPVILVSHSKGSVEVLETLIQYPALRSKVKAWINIQGAIHGSFFADSLTQKEFEESDNRSLAQIFLQQFYDLVMQVRAGNNQALLDLRTDHRKAYLTQHQREIQKIVRAIPVLSISSYAEFKDLPLNYRIGQNQLGIPDFDNDGLIATTHHILPGSYFITFANTHHNSLVAKSYGNGQKLFFKRVLGLVLH